MTGTLGMSFGTAAGDYRHGRPGYPADAVAWMIGEPPSRVLDLGAGTGKLTVTVAALGHDVVAVDPDEAMLSALRATVDGIPTHVGTAEAIPLPEASFDAVVAGQAWHWFDGRAASAEIGRVLRPGGVLGLVWNIRDIGTEWVARLGEVVRASAAEELIAGPGPELFEPFGALESYESRWSLPTSADAIRAMVRSRSYYITGDADYRSRIDAGVSALLSSLPETSHGGSIELPYVTHAFRATRP